MASRMRRLSSLQHLLKRSSPRSSSSSSTNAMASSNNRHLHHQFPAPSAMALSSNPSLFVSARPISIEALRPSDTFPRRHNSTAEDEGKMSQFVGFESLDSLIDATVPKSIIRPDMKLPKFDGGLTESQMLDHMKDLASKNKVFKSYIGMGYYNTYVPPVILRNILENPGWYTQYTPYQAEIAQGRLESLLNFQTMITDLTGMPMSNASLLDEGTAAAEAMAMCTNVARGKKKTFLIADHCHTQTIDICKTRSAGFDLDVKVVNLSKFDYSKNDVCGILVQYPATDGEIIDLSDVVKTAHTHGAKVVVSTDLLALTVLQPPGEFGADMVVGSAQRFGVPMGYGGPHAAFLATSQEYKRSMPGRIIGVSVDANGKPALRMAMQTREQHIRREKATSNICTAQVSLRFFLLLPLYVRSSTSLIIFEYSLRQFFSILLHGLLYVTLCFCYATICFCYGYYMFSFTF